MCYLLFPMRFFFCLMLVHVSMFYAAAQPSQNFTQAGVVTDTLQNQIEQLAKLCVTKNVKARAKSSSHPKRKLTRAQRSPIASPLACPVGSPARPPLPKPAE